MSVKRARNEGFGIAKCVLPLVFQRTSTPFGHFLNAQKRRFFGKMRVFAKLCKVKCKVFKHLNHCKSVDNA
jgi:hypothetical protein